MFWYTIGRIDKMCYVMSTGAVRWLAYEMVEKIILKIIRCNSLDISAVLTINFTN